MDATHGLCADIQGAPRKFKDAVSVSSMEARGSARWQGAPPTQTRVVSVASMEATHGLCAGIQAAPPKQ